MFLKKNLIVGLCVLSLSSNMYALDNPIMDLGTTIGSSIGHGISSLFSSSDNKPKEDVKNNSNDNNTSTSSGGIGGFLTSLFKGPTPEEMLAKSSDKEMTKAYLEAQKTNPKLTFTQDANTLTFDKVVVPFDAAATFGQARTLCAKLDTANDLIAEEYKKVITNRGNYYSIYSGTVNSAILSAVLGKLRTRNDAGDENYQYDFDNAIVEYAPDGTIVSALTRIDRISLNMMIRTSDINYMNIEIRQVSKIFTKQQIGVVSRIVSKRLFDDNLVLTSKPDIKPIVVQAKTEKDTSAKIKDLFDLYQAGALTKAEFDDAKKKLLNLN